MNREQCDNEDLHISIGALALGALDPDEAREVRHHLAECPECQAEYTSFVGVKRVMDVGLVGAPMPDPVDLDEPRPRFKKPVFATSLRRRVAVGTAGCAAALALVFGGFAVGRSNHHPASNPFAQATALPAVTQAGVTAQISYQGNGWGTWVNAKMSGAPGEVVCTLLVYDKNHHRVQLSTWKSVADKQIDIPAATALTPDQIDHFEVRVDDQGYDIMVPMAS